MLTYTFECETGGKFEYRQSISEPDLDRCPQGGKAVRKVIAGGMGFSLKGRGESVRHRENNVPCCERDIRCDKPPCGK